MKKIKQLNKIVLSDLAKSQIIGGLGGCEYDYCNLTDIDFNAPYPPHGGSGGSGSKNGSGTNTGSGTTSKCNNCNGLCMPGDNADFASWFGTKLSQQMTS